MKCIVCHQDDWENVDQYRFKPQGMSICKSCGFVSYPDKYKTDDELKRYYHDKYRQPPTVQNYYSGHRKLQIHTIMLSEYLKKWIADKRENLVFGEIGAAHGMFLNWLKKQFPSAEVLGTEWAKSYRRVASHMYQVDLDIDFDYSKKYDLLISFKVLEHQMDAGEYLKKYVECLKPDGLFYISVPTWFKKMTNPGMDGFDLEFHYSPNHINVWSREQFEFLLHRAGLKIIKQDHVMYDDTYVCIKDESQKPPQHFHGDYKAVKKTMEQIKTATELYMKGKFTDALNAFPNFPNAWIQRYEKERANAHTQKTGEQPFEYAWRHHVEPCIKNCPESLIPIQMQTDILMRYEQFDKAVQVLEKGLALRPNYPPFLLMLSHCFRQIGIRIRDKDPAQAELMFKESKDIVQHLAKVDPQSIPDSITWQYNDCAEISTDYERKS